MQIVLAHGHEQKGRTGPRQAAAFGQIRSIKRQILHLIAALIAASLMLPAATYQHKGCGLSMWLPDDWKVDAEESMLLASPMDDEATLQLTALQDVASLDAAWARYPAILKKVITAYRETQARRDVSINGMKGIAVGGEGILRGAKNSIRVIVFRGPKGFVMLMWSANHSASGRGIKQAMTGLSAAFKPTPLIAKDRIEKGQGWWQTGTISIGDRACDGRDSKVIVISSSCISYVGSSRNQDQSEVHL